MECGMYSILIFWEDEPGTFLDSNIIVLIWIMLGIWILENVTMGALRTDRGEFDQCLVWFYT
jgi:hypothetical protein